MVIRGATLLLAVGLLVQLVDGTKTNSKKCKYPVEDYEGPCVEMLIHMEGIYYIPGLESVKTAIFLIRVVRRLTKHLFSNPWRNARKSVSMVVHKDKKVQGLPKFQNQLMPDKPR